MTSPLEEVVITPDRVPLWTLRYEAAEPAQGTVVFSHGACEHAGRYLDIFAALQQAGWNVVAWDLRGHGRSGGTKTHLRSFDQYLDDMDAVWKYFALEPATTALLGHSMGGLLTIRYVQSRQLECRGLIAASPLLKLAIPIPTWLLMLGKRVRWFAPRWRFSSRVKQNTTTRDPEQLAIRREDQFIQRNVTVNWFYCVDAAINEAWLDAPQLRTPALVLQAVDDRIVSPEATEEWCRLATGSEVTYVPLADHYHELFHEADRFETLHLCIEWLKDSEVPE